MSEPRTPAVEVAIAKLMPAVVPIPLTWDAAAGTEEFPAGAVDTASVLVVSFAPNRFCNTPVVVATPRWRNGDWIGGVKDSFAVTTFNVSNTGFSALLRRVNPSGKPITAGVLLDWIAVDAKGAR